MGGSPHMVKVLEGSPASISPDMVKRLHPSPLLPRLVVPRVAGGMVNNLVVMDNRVLVTVSSQVEGILVVMVSRAVVMDSSQAEVVVMVSRAVVMDSSQAEV